MSGFIVPLNYGDQVKCKSDLTTTSTISGTFDVIQIPYGNVAFGAKCGGADSTASVPLCSKYTEAYNWDSPVTSTFYSKGVFTAPHDGLYVLNHHNNTQTR